MLARSTVVLVVIDPEELLVAIDGWNDFVDSFYSLRFLLVVVEKLKQWHRVDVTWSYIVWNGLYLRRSWALLDLAVLVNGNRRRDCRLYEEVVHQMKLCYHGCLSEEKSSTESSVLW